MIREVCSMERASTRDNVNRDYPLTGWMALPPHSWKAPGAGCIYRRGKKKNTHKVMTQVDGSEWGKLSLFNYWSISAGSSACIRLTSATWGVLFVRLLWNSLEGFMDIHATHHNLFSWSAGMKGGLSEAFFFVGGLQCLWWAVRCGI